MSFQRHRLSREFLIETLKRVKQQLDTPRKLIDSNSFKSEFHQVNDYSSSSSSHSTRSRRNWNKMFKLTVNGLKIPIRSTIVADAFNTNHLVGGSVFLYSINSKLKFVILNVPITLSYCSGCSCIALVLWIAYCTLRIGMRVVCVLFDSIIIT